MALDGFQATDAYSKYASTYCIVIALTENPFLDTSNQAEGSASPPIDLINVVLRRLGGVPISARSLITGHLFREVPFHL
ncbi:hypothetical protein J6590_014467 [Homalodisca vitripennis]|nr:hypothetical protein J6590_014467 [Homalodisca vitripennis]